jgi:hypothetical protein
MKKIGTHCVEHLERMSNSSPDPGLEEEEEKAKYDERQREGDGYSCFREY